jgi:hypothetical protein
MSGPRFRLVTIILAALALTCSLSASAGAATQGPALQQLNWLIGASARLPVPAAEIAQHIEPQFLTALGGPAGFNQALAKPGPLTLRQVLLDQPGKVEAIVGSTLAGPLYAEVDTGSSGLIAAFGAAPYVAAPRTWPQLDTRLRALAPEVSLAAMTLEPDGGCRPVHGVNATTARPLGSSFKLYVLGALGRDIARHQASWNTDLAIREQWKSLPSGVLQNEPAGTELTLRQYADYMISISDNTAADHLIHFLGRTAVQAQLFRFGNRSAYRDIPFLTTRELFALKGHDYPALAHAYLAGSRPQRAADLAALDQIPLSRITGWTQPELINQIEWFASPADMCRAYAGLWRENSQPGQNDLGAALSINDGGIALDRAQYPVVWFKGGSEPGVLTLNYLARSAGGRIVVASLMLANPDAPFSDAITSEVLALVRGAVQLASR